MKTSCIYIPIFWKQNQKLSPSVFVCSCVLGERVKMNTSIILELGVDEGADGQT